MLTRNASHNHNSYRHSLMNILHIYIEFHGGEGRVGSAHTPKAFQTNQLKSNQNRFVKITANKYFSCFDDFEASNMHKFIHIYICIHMYMYVYIHLFKCSWIHWKVKITVVKEERVERQWSVEKTWINLCSM